MRQEDNAVSWLLGFVLVVGLATAVEVGVEPGLAYLEIFLLERAPEWMGLISNMGHAWFALRDLALTWLGWRTLGANAWLLLSFGVLLDPVAFEYDTGETMLALGGVAGTEPWRLSGLHVFLAVHLGCAIAALLAERKNFLREFKKAPLVTLVPFITFLLLALSGQESWLAVCAVLSLTSLCSLVMNLSILVYVFKWVRLDTLRGSLFAYRTLSLLLFLYGVSSLPVVTTAFSRLCLLTAVASGWQSYENLRVPILLYIREQKKLQAKQQAQQGQQGKQE